MDVRPEFYPAYLPSPKEIDTRNEVLDAFTKMRLVKEKSYNQFNNRSLRECIDDWMKRWNGYVPPQNVLLDSDQSRIFLGFTRNAILTYLAKTALQRAKIKIKAVKKHAGNVDRKLSEAFTHLVDFSEDAENGDAKYLQAATECAVKGTVIAYEGYARQVLEEDVPMEFNAETGKLKSKKQERVAFDNCYEHIVPLEDFYILNPYQAELQKQPKIIWRNLTTKDEAAFEFARYPDWKYVRPGSYTLTGEPQTFYRNKLETELQDDQVEILRYWEKAKNRYIVMVNGVVLYDGPNPFKGGDYPFAKGVFEPAGNGNDFFWGLSFCNKLMGLQDLMNTLWNMMVDKTQGSLVPFALSSDLDDLIEDQTMRVNQVRKVGDINKWKFIELPGVQQGEQAMLQTANSFANQYATTGEAATASSPQGGKLQVRQVLLQQQEAMQKIGFSVSLMEDFERDRIELRLKHILQFYSIPKIEHILTETGKEVEQMLYRDIKLSGVKLSNGKTGNKVIKLVGSEDVATPDQERTLADQMAVEEELGSMGGTPTEVIALVVDTFNDFNCDVQVVKNSSYEKNEVLDQAVRHEYANWRLSLMQNFQIPVNTQELVSWVDESYDVDTDRFAAMAQPQMGAPAMAGAPAGGAPGAAPGQAPPQPSKVGAAAQGVNPARRMAPSALPPMSELM